MAADSKEAILVLLAAAADLLAEATRLNGVPNEWWSVSHVTKAQRPPLVLEAKP